MPRTLYPSKLSRPFRKWSHAKRGRFLVAIDRFEPACHQARLSARADDNEIENVTRLYHFTLISDHWAI